MPRKLALFFDGTWNTPGSDTNVCHLFRLTSSQRAFRGKLLGKAVEENQTTKSSPLEDQQLKYYHPGVGTTWGSRIVGGMFGWGLSKNIRDGLKWLTDHYQPDDEIFLFGFSRGAYTARSLAGIIRKCGIPRKSANGGLFSERTIEGLVNTAYRFYRERQWDVDGKEAEAFRSTFSWPEVRIKFLGVWDTVGALGLPLHEVWFGSDYYRFHDTGLSKIIDNACHAMALDEHRPDFAVTPWDKDKPPSEGQKVQQCWFAGAHADVGGGYKDGKLSQIPLRWMQERAEEAGLKFISQAQIDPDAFLAKMHDSLRDFAFGLYQHLPSVYEHYRPFGLALNETIHPSVEQRRSHMGGLDATGKKYNPPAPGTESGNAPAKGEITGKDFGEVDSMK